MKRPRTRPSSVPTDRRAVVMLTASLVGVLAFFPVFALSTLVVFGDASADIANGILLLDVIGPAAGLVGAILAWRGNGRLAFGFGIAGGALGLAAALGILVVTWPWDTVIAVRNLVLFHVWAAVLVAATLWPTPKG